MEFSRKMYLQKLVRADGNGMIKIVTGVVVDEIFHFFKFKV